MSLGIGLFLLIVGAILTFAVNVTTSGFNVNVVGLILMAGGALGILLWMMFWSSFAPRSRRTPPPPVGELDPYTERERRYERIEREDRY
jgi:hypothetical protein